MREENLKTKDKEYKCVGVDTLIDPNNKKQKGITLIALIITIIILLILAGVTINLTLGENGIFKTAEQAAKNYVEAQNQEYEYINNLDDMIKNVIGENTAKTLISQITPNDYGKSINYSVTVKDNNNQNITLNDWKVFYNDGSNVYIIMSECLDGSLFPATSGLSSDGANEGYEWSAGWVNARTSSEAIENLSNNQVWAAFANGKNASNAIGTPTMEMLIASWNSNPKMSETQLEAEKCQFGITDPTGLYIVPTDRAGRMGRILAS